MRAPIASESDLMHMLLQAAPAALPDVRLFRRNVMAAHLNGGHFVRAGIRGQADLYGYVRGGGVIELECKAARGRASLAQTAWRDFCEKWQVPYLVLRVAPNEAPGDTVARWLREIRSVTASWKTAWDAWETA